jgi:hypothetical protein
LGNFPQHHNRFDLVFKEGGQIERSKINIKVQ